MLVIDDAPSAAWCWENNVAELDLDVEPCTSFAAARKRLTPQRWRHAPCEYVIVDLRLGDGNGEDLLPLLAELDPRPAVAVVSGYLIDTPTFQLQLAAKCALAIDRDLMHEDYIAVIERLEAHRRLIAPVVAFVEQFGLSEQEAAVVRLACQDLSDDEIGKALGVGTGTVYTYWERTKKKTGKNSRVGIVGAILEGVVKSTHRT